MSKRLLKELKDMRDAIRDDPDIGIGATPKDDNMSEWQAIIIGPKDTPFEGSWLQLTIKFSSDYPHKPPKITFDHTVFHPNVYTNNKICLDILQEQWTPMYKMTTVLVSIRSLLNDPNPKSPANVDASSAFKHYDPADSNNKYSKLVREALVKTNHFETPLPEWYHTLYEEAMLNMQED